MFIEDPTHCAIAILEPLIQQPSSFCCPSLHNYIVKVKRSHSTLVAKLISDIIQKCVLLRWKQFHMYVGYQTFMKVIDIVHAHTLL